MIKKYAKIWSFHPFIYSEGIFLGSFQSEKIEREMLLKRKQSTKQTQIDRTGMTLFRDREADNRRKNFTKENYERKP